MQSLYKCSPSNDFRTSNPSLRWALSCPGHAVQFYDDDEYLREVAVNYFVDGLKAGQSVISIATRSHSDVFIAGLTARGFDVNALQQSGALVLVDACDTLEQIMDGAQPDSERFRQVVGGMIDRAGGRRKVVRAYGEMVDVLCQNGNTPAAIRLEQLWNALASGYHFALLCSYSIATFRNATHRAAFEEVCGHHHHVIPTDPRVTAVLGPQG